MPGFPGGGLTVSTREAEGQTPDLDRGQVSQASQSALGWSPSPSLVPRAKGGPVRQGALTPFCSAHSYVQRMKEYERERRLLQRKKRREQREAGLARSQVAA